MNRSSHPFGNWRADISRIVGNPSLTRLWKSCPSSAHDGRRTSMELPTSNNRFFQPDFGSKSLLRWSLYRSPSHWQRISGLHQEFGRPFKARTTAQKIVKAQPIGKYRFSQCQASGWTKRTMVASKTLRLPHSFDFSKNREYSALRIAGGKRKRRIENALLMDGSAPPKDVATGRRITPSTTRSKLIAPSGASRNRNDNQFLICRKVDTKPEGWRRGCL
jgi:hypothetical protein